MKKEIVFVCLISLVSVAGISQRSVMGDTVSGSLMHLKYQTRFVPKYVNFDVLKIMFSRGNSLQSGVNYGFGQSLNIQVLYPYAILKNSFPIAVGLNIGYSKMSLLESELVFTENKLTAIVNNADVKSSMQRTGYVGLVLLRAIRVHSLTFLVGGSVNLNTIGRLKIIGQGDKTKSNDISKLNRVSIPLHLQISRSPRQLWSAGIFCSYDTKSRFKGETYNKLKQFNTGVSLAVIL